MHSTPFHCATTGLTLAGLLFAFIVRTSWADTGVPATRIPIDGESVAVSTEDIWLLSSHEYHPRNPRLVKAGPALEAAAREVWGVKIR